MARKEGLFRLSDATAVGVHAEYVRRLTHQGQLTRVGRGLYALPTLAPTEHHTLAEVATRVPKAVFCLLTALRFHGLGTQNPREVWLAVDRRAGIPRIDFTPIRTVRISGTALTAGIETHTIDGAKVRVTSPARTVVELLQISQQDRYRRRGRGAAGLPPHAEGNPRCTVARSQSTASGQGHASLLGWDVMTRKPLVNISASVRARLLKVAKERREDFTLTLMNYAAERFLYRLSKSKHRDQFVLKGAMLFAVRIGEPYRPTRDLDLLGLGEATETAIKTAVSEIAATPVEDDGLVFDAGTLTVHAIREDNRYGGLRAVLQARLAEARIHVQIDVGFGDAISPGALDLEFPTLLTDMASPRVLAYPTETIIAEKAEAIVDLGISNSRMKDFSDVAVAARRVAFDGESLVAALRATFRRRGTSLPDGDIVPLSVRFVQDASAQANWKAFAARSGQSEFETLEQVVRELQRFLGEPIVHARSTKPFGAHWNPGGPWT